MNKGMLTVGIILLSLIALLLLNILTNFSTGSELDYYLVKETTDASIKDALDDTLYSDCGIIRIDREKFIDNFLYRFANGVDTTRGYKISFYDINEYPPKVSVKVDSLTVLSFKSGSGENEKNESATISTSYDSIVESVEKIDPVVEIQKRTYTKDFCKQILEKSEAKSDVDNSDTNN